MIVCLKLWLVVSLLIPGPLQDPSESSPVSPPPSAKKASPQQAPASAPKQKSPTEIPSTSASFSSPSTPGGGRPRRVNNEDGEGSKELHDSTSLPASDAGRPRRVNGDGKEH